MHRKHLIAPPLVCVKHVKQPLVLFKGFSYILLHTGFVRFLGCHCSHEVDPQFSITFRRLRTRGEQLYRCSFHQILCPLFLKHTFAHCIQRGLLGPHHSTGPACKRPVSMFFCGIFWWWYRLGFLLMTLPCRPFFCWCYFFFWIFQILSLPPLLTASS